METRGKKPTKANLEAKKSQGGVREKPTKAKKSQPDSVDRRPPDRAPLPPRPDVHFCPPMFTFVNAKRGWGPAPQLTALPASPYPAASGIRAKWRKRLAFGAGP
jgi:hypothetical protein